MEKRFDTLRAPTRGPGKRTLAARPQRLRGSASHRAAQALFLGTAVQGRREKPIVVPNRPACASLRWRDRACGKAVQRLFIPADRARRFPVESDPVHIEIALLSWLPGRA